MKNTILLVFVAVLTQFSVNAEVVISGKILNSNKKTIEIIREGGYLNSKKENIKAIVNKNGEFKIKLDISHPQKGMLKYGKEDTPLFLKDGDNLVVSFNNKEFDKTMSFKGVGATVNNFLAKRYLHFEKIEYSKSYEWEYISEFSKVIYNKELDFYNKYFETNKEDIEFKKWFQNHITIEYINSLMISWQSNSYNLAKEVNDSCRRYIRKELLLIDINQPELLEISDDYQYFIIHYIDQFRLREYFLDNKDALDDNYKFLTHCYNISKNELKDKVLYHYFSMLINSYLSNTTYDILIECFNDFKTICTDKTLISQLEANFDKIRERRKEMKISRKASLVKIDENLSGEESFNQLLEENKGKVIYVDIWASWCSSCIKEMPNSLKLKKKIKDKDFVILYLALDDKEEAWKKAISFHNLEGKHYMFTKKQSSEISEMLKMKGFPTYVLINKNGEIVDNCAKWPSDKTLIEDIEKLLKKLNHL